MREQDDVCGELKQGLGLPADIILLQTAAESLGLSEEPQVLLIGPLPSGRCLDRGGCRSSAPDPSLSPAVLAGRLPPRCILGLCELVDLGEDGRQYGLFVIFP